MKKKIMDRYIDEPGTVTVKLADGRILIESKVDQAKRVKAEAKQAKNSAAKARYFKQPVEPGLINSIPAGGWVYFEYVNDWTTRQVWHLGKKYFKFTQSNPYFEGEHEGEGLGIGNQPLSKMEIRPGETFEINADEFELAWSAS